MLYTFCKIYVRLASKIFCRTIYINKPELLKSSGPLLLACNHPNSFLDAIILDILFQQPVYSLTRGDVFKNRLVCKILTSLKMLPVYRISEGAENLNYNYRTFEECKALFQKGGIVQIFSEGFCINEWHLRPLKKGTARLAFNSWKEGIPLQILPVGINYSSFRRFGKNVFLNFGTLISKNDFDLNEPEGKKFFSFNQQLQSQLQQLVFEIPAHHKAKQKALLEKKPALLTRLILFIPSVTGWLLHAPFYIPLKLFTLKKAGHNDHYDSVLAALLTFTYPVYVLLITFLTWNFTQMALSFLLFIFLPFTAWAHVQLKPQLDR